MVGNFVTCLLILVPFLPHPPPVWNTLGLKEVLTQLPFSSLEPEGAEQTLFAMLELVWELPEGLVSVLPNLQLSGGKVA